MAKPREGGGQSASQPKVRLCVGLPEGPGSSRAWAWRCLGRVPAGGRPLTSAALVQRKVYLVESVLTSFLLGLVEAGSPEQAPAAVGQVLDLLWLFMEVRLLRSGLGPGRAPWAGAGEWPSGLPHPVCAAGSLSRNTRCTTASSS